MSRDTAFIAPRTGPTRNSSPFGLALLRQLVALFAMERSRAISSVLIRRTARFYSRTRRCLAIIGDVFTYRHNGKQYFGVCSCVGGWAAIGLAGRLTNPTDGLGAVRGYIRASTATPRWGSSLTEKDGPARIIAPALCDVFYLRAVGAQRSATRLSRIKKTIPI